MGFSAEVPVFIDTNLGTRIAMAISPEITAGDLKRKLGDEHSICFPDIGKISIHGLMVKKKTNFYRLPDSTPIKNVFLGLKGAWFLRINATPVISSNKCCPLEGLKDSVLYGSDITDSQKLEDFTNWTIMKDTDENSVQSKRKMPTSPEDLMKELLSPVNVAKDLKDSALCGSDVTDSQKPEDSTNGTIMKDCNENVGRLKRKMPTSLEDLMKELLSAANVPKEKKRRKKKKKKTKEIHLPVKCPDGSKERFLDKNEESEGVSSQGRLCQFNSLKKTKKENKKMELSPDSSDVVSVTGIITRYFPEYDEVKSYLRSSECEINNKCESTHQADGNGTSKYNAVWNCSESETLDQRVSLNASVPLPTNPNPKTPRHKIGLSKATKTQSSKVLSVPIPRASRGAKLGSSKTEQLLPPKTPFSIPLPTIPSPKTSKDKKLGRSEVGKRLIQAANDLGISTVKKKQPGISLKPSSNLVRELVFDISDGDD